MLSVYSYARLSFVTTSGSGPGLHGLYAVRVRFEKLYEYMHASYILFVYCILIMLHATSSNCDAWRLGKGPVMIGSGIQLIDELVHKSKPVSSGVLIRVWAMGF